MHETLHELINRRELLAEDVFDPVLDPRCDLGPEHNTGQHRAKSGRDNVHKVTKFLRAARALGCRSRTQYQ